jgi:hypothetical protein
MQEALPWSFFLIHSLSSLSQAKEELAQQLRQLFAL